LRFARVAGIAARVNHAPVIAVQGLVCARVVAGSPANVEIPALSIERGSVTMLAGPPGCGKNLLLRVLGLLETPDSGEVWFEGQATANLSEETRSQLRTRRCGYVFASPFLLPEFTVIENIAMPLFKICDMETEEARDRSEEMLDFAGLQKVATSRDLPPAVQRRVALARALAARPGALFVEDLPLSEEDAEGFRELLHRAAERFGVAVVSAIRPEGSEREGERRVQLSAGRLASEVTP
jgi:ABC-type lipoprotein export system ATPase subunit